MSLSLTILKNQAAKLTKSNGTRYVDFGVRIMVVKQSEHGKSIKDLPPLSVIRPPIYRGGRYDTVTHRFVGPCDNWTTWLIGEMQADILFDPNPKQHNLLYSAEGGGKTILAGQWSWLQIIKATKNKTKGTLGAVAPTAKRLGSLVKAVASTGVVDSVIQPNPHAWGTLYADKGELKTITGHTIQFRATQTSSANTGSPLQGYTFNLGAACDETQDLATQGAMEDVVARLRGGKASPIFGTATAKDSPGWRNYRDSLSEDYWAIHRLPYTAAFAIWPSHWAMMQANLSERAWRRRGLALDVGPENAVYTSFDRKRHLREIPLLGAKDITASTLGHGSKYQVLIGVDPGTVQDYAIILKAYKLHGQSKPVWFAVGEYRTKQSTSEAHANGLRGYLQDTFGIQYKADDDGYTSGEGLVRMDPQGTTDSKTDSTVYVTYRKAGFKTLSGQYTQKGQPQGRVPKEPGIEMVNSLLKNAQGETRLYLATDAQGNCLVPLLLEALEMSERDAAGRAHASTNKSRKGAGGDLSDAPAALRYALWQLEKPKYSSGHRREEVA